MSLTPGGAVFLGTCGLVALMDGGVGELVGSCIVGGITYFAVRTTPNVLAGQIVESQLVDWNNRIADEQDPKKKQELEKEAAAAEKLYRSRLGHDYEQIRFNAALIGIGTVMAPMAGIAVALIYTSQWWGPAAMAALDMGLDTRHEVNVLGDVVKQFEM